MDAVVKEIGFDGFDEGLKLSSLVYYGTAPSSAELEGRRKILGDTALMGVFYADKLVATAANLSLELTIPGGVVVPVLGLTEVAVLPTHRRRGAMRSLVQDHLARAKESGAIASILQPTESSIYGRFGYGVGTYRVDWEMVSGSDIFDAADYNKVELSLIRDKEEITRVLPPLFDSYRVRQAGEICRGKSWWSILADDPEWNRNAPGNLQHVVATLDGKCHGYASYRFVPEWEGSLPNHRVVVSDLVTLSAAGMSSLVRYLTNIDLSRRVLFRMSYPSDSLRELFQSPRLVRTVDNRDFLWIRIVDTPAALVRRHYRGKAQFVIEVVDGECRTTYEVEANDDGAYCQESNRSPDLSISLATLSSVFLGSGSLVEMAKIGRASYNNNNVIEIVDRAFATPGPRCSTRF